MQNSAFSIHFVVNSLVTLLHYVPITLLITALSICLGLVLGLFVTIGQLVPNRVLNGLSIGFIALMRGTPMLLLLLLIYYGLPLLLQSFAIDISGWNQVVFAILALSINISAYFSETMRSAYSAISADQYEAGLSVGMSNKRIISRIIVPQATAIALPNIGNSMISIIKHSSLVYAIGITDIYQQAQTVASSTFGMRQLEVFVAVALIYWMICILVERIIAVIEGRFSYLR
ncbi:MAG: amino acid transporter permease [Sphingobacterium sp.]|jgi:L-cystine transport system permease protein|nr:amino acid transporter permease [Sphingobacterium sp.]